MTFLRPLIFLLLFIYSVASIAQDLKWIRYGRGGGYEGNKTWAVGNDALGNVYTAGYFTSDINLGDTTLKTNGKDRLFIAKYDSSGDVLCSSCFE